MAVRLPGGGSGDVRQDRGVGVGGWEGVLKHGSYHERKGLVD
jgi:hypothetical protein